MASAGGESDPLLLPVYYTADGIPVSRAEVPIAEARPIADDPYLLQQSGNYQYSSWHQPDREANYRRNEDDFFWWYCLCLLFWITVLIVVIAVTSSVYDDDDYVR